MTISPAWTPDERLAVIKSKSEQARKLLCKFPLNQTDQFILLDLTEEVSSLTADGAEFLEANRSRLMEGVE